MVNYIVSKVSLFIIIFYELCVQEGKYEIKEKKDRKSIRPSKIN